MSGSPENTIPTPNAHAQSLTNGIDSLSLDEKIIYNYHIQIEKSTWMGPPILIDEQENKTITQPPSYEQPQSYQIGIKFNNKETKIEKKDIDIQI